MLDYYDELRREGEDIKRQQIMLIWSFKMKRQHDGRLSKYKARLCYHRGQKQWDIQYWETYFPVVTWTAVRTLLVLSKVYNLHTKSIDVTISYPQANIKVPIYLDTPKEIDSGEGSDKLVLKLKKNIYGLNDAGLTWR